MLMVNALVAFAVIMSAFGGFADAETSLDDSSVTDDLSAISSFKVSDYPQLKAFEHSQAVGGDYRALTVSDGADSFSRLYVYLYHPSGAKLQYWDSKASAYLGASGYRFRMSVSGAYDSYFLADAKLLSVSSDNLFAKFRIDYQFPFSDFSASRGYELSAFEIMGSWLNSGESLTVSNSYALGERFVVSGKPGAETVSHDLFDVLSLDCDFSFYQFATPNPHSTDVAWWKADILGWPDKTTTCYSQVFTLCFHFSSSLGSMVGLRMGWNATMYEASKDRNSDYSFRPVSGTSEDHLIDYTDSDRNDLSSEISKGAFVDFLAGLGFKSWIKKDWSSKTVPVIQKLDSAKILASDAVNDDYFLGEKGVSWFKSEYPKAPLEDFYAVHFDIRDVATTATEVPWSAWYTPVGTVWGLVEIIKGDSYCTRWGMTDISVISLKMKKDGKAYVLPVSADAGHIQSGWYSAAKSFDWMKLLRIVGLCAGVFAGVYVVYRVAKKIRGKGHGGRR